MSDRRGFLRSGAMTMAAARLGLFGPISAGADLATSATAVGQARPAEPDARESRELASMSRATEWINSPELTAAGLRGKVVVIDFCTYTCINWLRTLPYRRAWAQKYASGLVLIGVHTPEFGFEKNVGNVRRALRQLGVAYPIAIDNDYRIWRAFNNQYWPALYFVDARGRLRHQQFGEGEYDRSEMVIGGLLAETGLGGAADRSIPVEGAGIEAVADWGNLKSPETYLGYERTARFASPGGVTPDRPRRYAAPARLALNQWTLAGEWTMGREGTVLDNPAGRIAYRFQARDVHLVMGPSRQGASIRFRVTLDGKPPGPARGLDVDEAGAGMAVEQRLHQLIRQAAPIVERRFEIEFLDGGVEAFAFTFG